MAVRNTYRLVTRLVTLMVVVSVARPVFADSISPNIGDTGKVYSTEKADHTFFGTGSLGKLTEASHLRFMGDQLVGEGKLDEAIKTLAKAVQFDPTDPSGHVMLARAMTQKLRSNRESMDWELYGQCLDEWRLLARHDADHLEQLEARTNISNLKKLAKAHIAKAKGKTNKRSSMLAGLNPLKHFR